VAVRFGSFLLASDERRLTRGDEHLHLTPKGKKVTVRAELIEVDGRKLRFKVEAHDEEKKVGDGTHRRAIIAVQRKA